MNTVYDVAIIGGGPAGLSAALYAARARLSTVLFEKLSYGGQVMLTDKIENYPGVIETTGMDLATTLYTQAQRHGVTFVQTGIADCKPDTQQGQDTFKLVGSDTTCYQALSLIVATGAHWRTLGVPGEEKFHSRGVSYCATCDGPLYKGKEIVVVGGGDAAIEEAVFLTKFVKKLTLVHRRGMLRAAKILQEALLKEKNVVLKVGSVLTEIRGDTRVKSVVVQDVDTGEPHEIPAQGVFIFIGLVPNSDVICGMANCDSDKHIITDEAMRTSCPGIFAAGDVRRKTLRQVVTAASDGAVAAYHAEQYVRKLKGEDYR
jgi:thioredoxin reductase (NADPH)